MALTPIQEAIVHEAQHIDLSPKLARRCLLAVGQAISQELCRKQSSPGVDIRIARMTAQAGAIALSQLQRHAPDTQIWKIAKHAFGKSQTSCDCLSPGAAGHQMLAHMAELMFSPNSRVALEGIVSASRDMTINQPAAATHGILEPLDSDLGASAYRANSKYWLKPLRQITPELHVRLENLRSVSPLMIGAERVGESTGRTAKRSSHTLMESRSGLSSLPPAPQLIPSAALLIAEARRVRGDRAAWKAGPQLVMGSFDPASISLSNRPRGSGKALLVAAKRVKATGQPAFSRPAILPKPKPAF